MRIRLIVASALAGVMLPVFVSGQEKKPALLEVRGGFSAVSGYSASALAPPTYSGYLSLGTFYGDYFDTSFYTNNIGAEFLAHFGKRSSIGIGIYANHMWSDSYNAVTGEKSGRRTAAALFFLPTYRGYYMSRDVVRIYGTVSLGLTACFMEDIKFVGAFNISPIGVEVGRRFYGFAEAGFGTVYSGISLGVGYKF